MHRSIVAALLGVAVLAPASTAQKSQEQLEAQRAEKLAKEVFKKAPWLLDYDVARQQAKESGKPILVYFTRSYSP